MLNLCRSEFWPVLVKRAKSHATRYVTSHSAEWHECFLLFLSASPEIPDVVPALEVREKVLKPIEILEAAGLPAS